MNQQIELMEKIVSIMNLAQSINKLPRTFGLEEKLYPSEVHMIEAISNHQELNASELSEKLGITNGAVNQVTAKLAKKGFIEPYRMAGNRKEVFYRLTSKGEQVDRAHAEFHKGFYEKLTEKLSGTDVTAIHMFLDEWLKTLKEYEKME